MSGVFDISKKHMKRYKKYFIPERRKILGIGYPPKHLYHQTTIDNLKTIIRSGLIPTDIYNPGDIPVIWFDEKPHWKDQLNIVTIKINTNDLDKNLFIPMKYWKKGIWGYPEIISPEYIYVFNPSKKRIHIEW